MICKVPAHINAQLSPENLKQVCQALFFTTDKDICAVDKKVMTGHIPMGQEVTDSHYGPDQKEIWHFCRFEHILPDDKSFYPENIFPPTQLHVRGLIEDLYRSADSITHQFLEELGQRYPHHRRWFSEAVHGHNILRFLHYPPSSNNAPYAIPPHVDSSLFTILLFQDGGEFCYEDNGKTRVLKANKDEVLILPGLLLELLTEGEIKAVSHHVVFDENSSSRLSALFFVHPKPFTVLNYHDPRSGGELRTMTCSEFLWRHAQDLHITYE